MHIVTVVFEVHAQHLRSFVDEVRRNAERSLAIEPGCRQFDVCTDSDGAVFLYEAYDDPAAFAAHLAAPHFLAFDQLTRPWVRSKVVRSFTRLPQGCQ